MSERILLVGFDATETNDLSRRLQRECISYEMLPRIVVHDGRLFVEALYSPHYLPISRVVFHGIFEHDLDFPAALALWGGPCFPNPTAMMDCRLRLPCLVRALKYTRFGGKRESRQDFCAVSYPTWKVACNPLSTCRPHRSNPPTLAITSKGLL